MSIKTNLWALSITDRFETPLHYTAWRCLSWERLGSPHSAVLNINCYFNGVLLLLQQRLITSFSHFVKCRDPARLLRPGFILSGQNWYREALENLHLVYDVRLSPCITSKKFRATAGYVNSAPDSRQNRKVFWQDGRKCWTAVDFVQVSYLGLHLVKKQCQVEIPEKKGHVLPFLRHLEYATTLSCYFLGLFNSEETLEMQCYQMK